MLFHSVRFLFQVWDTMIIDSALKTFYNSDLATMILAIQRNITVWFSFFLICYVSELSHHQMK